MNLAQFRTILWLRWRLTGNQWRRSGSFGAALAALGYLGAAVIVIGGFTTGILVGAGPLTRTTPEVVLLTWDFLSIGWLFLWSLGLLIELQRSESIDLQRMMHLPVSLKEVFLFNYLVSHFTLSVLTMAPTMLGLTLGMALGRGPLLLLLLPLSASLVFMVTAWSYCFRGWLATLMVNQRRRRTIVACLTLAMVLLGQLPNLFNVFRQHADLRPVPPEEQEARRRDKEAADAAFDAKAAQVHRYLPLLWLPYGARRLAEGDATAAILGAAGGFVIGAWGLRRAFRGTVRFYHGETGKRVLAAKVVVRQEAAPPPGAARPSRFLEARLPGIPEPAAAVALATMRSILRAPEMKMALAMPLVMSILFGSMLFARSGAAASDSAKPFIATGIAAGALFFLQQLLSNHFGFDRHGFRALVLSPVERRHILLGKNLAFLPFALGLGFLFLSAAGAWLRIPVLAVAAAAFQLITILVILSTLGNLVSVVSPYRIQPGSMKATKMPAKAVAILLLSTFLYPLLILPAFVPPLLELGWEMAKGPTIVPVNLLLSLPLAALAILAYWWSLAPLGRLLQRRETEILEVVTAEVE